MIDYDLIAKAQKLAGAHVHDVCNQLLIYRWYAEQDELDEKGQAILEGSERWLRMFVNSGGRHPRDL